MSIYVLHGGNQLGPFTEVEIRTQLATGAITTQDLVWWQGQTGWMPLSQSPLAASLTATAPMAAPIVPGHYPGGYGPQGAPNSNLALWALLSGAFAFLLGCPALLCGPLVFFCFILSIIAIVLGHLALSEIKKNPALNGRGQAQIGLALGYISLAMWLLLIIIIVVFITMNPQKNNFLDRILQSIQSAQNMTNAPDQNIPSDNSDQATNAAPTNQ